MVKRLILSVAISGAISFLMSPYVFAQSKEEGIRLFDQAKIIEEKAQTNEQLKQAAEKYVQALQIFEKVNYGKGVGWAGNNLGMIYAGWGQYDKAKEFYEKSLATKRALKDRRGEGITLNNLGNVYKDWGEYEKAKETYEKSLIISRELKSRRDESIALNNLGILYKNWGRLDKAKEFFELSLSISRELKDRLGEGETFMNLGLIYKEWGQYDKAVDCYNKSLTICNALQNQRCKGRTLANMGHVYYAWGRYDRARDCYEKSFTIRASLKDRKGEGISLMSLGLVYKDLGQYEKAQGFYEKALAIFKEIRDRRDEGITLQNIGDVYKERGQYAKAVDRYENALSIRNELQDLRGAGFSFNSLGDVYKEWGQYNKAMENYEKALAIRRELKSPEGESQSLSGLANLCAAWGQYNKALEMCEASLRMKRKLQDRRGEATVIVDIGSLYQQMGNLDKAIQNFLTGVRIFNEIKVPTLWPEGLIAATYLDKGQIDEALPFIRNLASQDQEQRTKDALWGLEARLNIISSNYALARECYERILTSAEKSRSADHLFSANTGLGLAYEGLGDYSKAAHYYLQAVNFSEELRSSLNRSERAHFFDVRVEGLYRTAPYKGLARVLTKMKKFGEALRYSEYTKARIFAESFALQSNGKGLDVPADIWKEDVELNDELAALKKARQKGYEKENQEIIAAIENQIRKMEHKLATHVTMLRARYPLFAATKYPEPLDLTQSNLEENEWVLAYDVTDKGLLLYLARGKELLKTIIKPITKNELAELVRKLRLDMELGTGQSILRKLETFDFVASKKLADILLADVLPVLPKDAPVIVIPDDCLGVVPFEMLVLNEGGRIATDKTVPRVTDADFFGDRNAISYYQSITALTIARTLGKGQNLGDKILAMVDPIFSTDDPRLVQMEKEKRQKLLATLDKERLMSIRNENGVEFTRLALTSQLGHSLKKADPARTDLYEGIQAKKSFLLEKDLTIYRSIVFGTHGHYGQALAGIQEPVLVLTLVDQPKGQDGFLRLSEVMGLKMNCEVAALTACQSGLGKQISGEGTMGMGRAFQYAGAKSVLMSLWSVAESSSVDLVTSFFKHLREGKNKLEALRLAREEIRKAGYDHPFFWAPFILAGEVD